MRQSGSISAPLSCYVYYTLYLIISFYYALYQDD